jgi:endonuclease/exonuclease/phosphatase family metal-dependent hydrolase
LGFAYAPGVRRLAAWAILALAMGCSDGGDDVIDDEDLTVATLNVLHGLFCPNGTNSCRLEERVDLLFQWVEGSDCPDVVALQEVTSGVEELVRARAAGACPFEYEVIYERFNAVDDAIVLSRHPAIEQTAVELHGGFRHVLVARLDHPRGIVDIATTHLASGSDGATDPCGDDCPSECAAASTIRQCQAIQLGALLEGRSGARVTAITGDFNAAPGTFEYDHLVDLGWIDSYADAGNPECDPGSGIGCTSGRQDEDLSDIESPELNHNERIDYIFTAGQTDCSLASAGGWAHQPNPFSASCGPAPDPPCWPSDHGGVELDLDCSPL